MHTILPRSQGKVLGVKVSGKIGIEEERELIAAAERLLEAHEKGNFLIVLGDHVSGSLEAAAADIKWVLTHMSRIGKIAIVTDSKLLSALIAIDARFASLAGIEERHFSKDDLGTAWEWIES